MLSRRSLLGGFALFVIGCRKKQDAAPAEATCDEIPEETTGPFPDTTKMVASEARYRRAIAEDRVGTPLAVTLTCVDTSCRPIAGAHVEVWHCDADGVYSEYANGGAVGSTYCRGVQTTDANGRVTFETIFPGWYMGRATHIHITVYNGTSPVKVTQLAFPDAVEAEAHTASHYARGPNPMSRTQDMVFGDGDALELATVTGSVDAGYHASLQVAVADYATPSKHAPFEDHFGPGGPGGPPPPGMGPPPRRNRE